ncbi:MAG: protein kinase [Deltaproteobacteria bacterium]|nr:protein kinase [Deltaproteobacteria bacterium]
MPAKHIPIGEPAHDAERQGIRFLVDGLDERFTVYSNAWLAERSGVIHELDAVVVSPHGFYVVELKSWRGDIKALDHDWYVPHAIRSPLKTTRVLAQKLKDEIKRRSADAARPWVEFFVLLSHTGQVSVFGPLNTGRVHTRKTIIEALGNAKTFYDRAGGQMPKVDAHAAKVLDDLLRGVDKRFAPPRRIREYELGDVLERSNRYVEYLSQHALTGERKVLRVYAIAPLAEQAEQQRTELRCRWEAQVLARVAEERHILGTDPPFRDEAGLCLPFEYFEGLSLPSWLERHAKKLAGPAGLATRVGIWQRVAGAIRHAHGQGVVHRMLRPDVVLVQDKRDDPDVRLTGFDLAKQIYLGQTIHVTTMLDERLRWGAPELGLGLSHADPQSDQFGLGVILAFVLTGKVPFESTAELKKRGGLITRVRECNPYVPQSLDDAVLQMLRLRPAARYPSLGDAIGAVTRALQGKDVPRASPAATAHLDPENILPETRIGPDYEILGKLGAGGLATVYAARHLVSGTSRALKIARPDPAAEEALRAEYRALVALDHPNVVRAVDLSNMVPERVTLVLERVKGLPLSEWLRHPTDDTPETRRRYAEHLLGALEYLEHKGVAHKDIKPDNLIVGEDGLTLIDFSLAGQPSAELGVGTALYRDPALREWSPASDRYAAALSLFELYVGRRAFEGRAAEPGEEPHLSDDDVDPPGLVAFFRRALHPAPESRFASAVAMRAELLAALGAKVTTSRPAPAPSPSDDAQTPLSATSLSGTAVAVLRRASIHTQGDLVAMTPAQIGSISGLGTKKRREVLAFREGLVGRGVPPVGAQVERRRLWEPLVGDKTEIHRLALPPALTDALMQAGHRTVGSLAEATRESLTAIPKVGAGRVAQVVEALQKLADATAEEGSARSLDEIWRRATAPLKGHQHTVLARTYGIEGQPATQAVLAEELDTSQPAVSLQLQKAKEALNRRAFDEILDTVAAMLDALGGVARLDELARDVEAEWPASDALSTAGLLQLLADLDPRRLSLVEEAEAGLLVTRNAALAKGLAAFATAARQIASGFPVSPDAARRSLRSVLPEYELDPLSLASRVLVDVRLTDAGELFETPMYPNEAIRHVIRRERLPLSLEELRRAVERIFSGAAVWPDQERLAKTLAGIEDCRVEGDMVLPAAGKSVTAPHQESDPVPPELRVAAKSPEEVAADLLRGAASHGDGFRLVVSPAELAPEVGRSLARALGPEVRFVSFEQELLGRMDGAFDGFVRAERFKAQRGKLTREADGLLADLLAREGRSGATVVLGDTAIFAVCEALHLVRKLYDETSAGGRGFWIMVVPGVVYQKQPLFLERAPIFHPESTLPILRAIEG